MLLAQLRAERELRRVEKEDAEERLRVACRAAQRMQFDVEQAATEFATAQARVGEMRSRLRAKGLLHISSC